VRAATADSLAFYDEISSYQKIVAREGVGKAAELAVIGTTDTVHRGLKSYLDAGATDVALVPLQNDLADLKPVWEAASALPR
jgi:alkanesulfonate monooxygenase SsuD/methylene tetrahydromethanopterin reductase-like flavin-dependent oxidoreductase (luciferase family)